MCTFPSCRAPPGSPSWPPPQSRPPPAPPPCSRQPPSLTTLEVLYEQVFLWTSCPTVAKLCTDKDREQNRIKGEFALFTSGWSQSCQVLLKSLLSQSCQALQVTSDLCRPFQSTFKCLHLESSSAELSRRVLPLVQLGQFVHLLN